MGAKTLEGDGSLGMTEAKALADFCREALDRLSPEQRLEVFDDLLGEYCAYCGRRSNNDSDCHCMNDE